MKILAAFLIRFGAACADYTLGRDSEVHAGLRAGVDRRQAAAAAAVAGSDVMLR